jgi:hypothetical protein
MASRISNQAWSKSLDAGRGHLKCDGTRAETRFGLSAKRTCQFKRAGSSVQSTTGSRVVRVSGSNAGCTTFRGSVKSTGYLLHSPVSLSLPLPYATVCHHISTGVYTLHTSNWQRNLFSKKIQLTGFSSYPDSSPSQLIGISGVVSYYFQIL